MNGSSAKQYRERDVDNAHRNPTLNELSKDEDLESHHASPSQFSTDPGPQKCLDELALKDQEADQERCDDH
jgi:hypothetical protein